MANEELWRNLRIICAKAEELHQLALLNYGRLNYVQSNKGWFEALHDAQNPVEDNSAETDKPDN